MTAAVLVPVAREKRVQEFVDVNKHGFIMLRGVEESAGRDRCSHLGYLRGENRGQG